MKIKWKFFLFIIFYCTTSKILQETYSYPIIYLKNSKNLIDLNPKEENVLEKPIESENSKEDVLTSLSKIFNQKSKQLEKFKTVNEKIKILQKELDLTRKLLLNRRKKKFANIKKIQNTLFSKNHPNQEKIGKRYDISDESDSSEELIPGTTTLPPIPVRNISSDQGGDYSYYDDEEEGENSIMTTIKPIITSSRPSFLRSFLNDRVNGLSARVMPWLSKSLSSQIENLFHLGFTGTDMVFFVGLAVINGVNVSILSGLTMITGTIFTRLFTLGQYPASLGANFTGFWDNITFGFI